VEVAKGEVLDLMTKANKGANEKCAKVRAMSLHFFFQTLLRLFIQSVSST
jgi:hypothetical protein